MKCNIERRSWYTLLVLVAAVVVAHDPNRLLRITTDTASVPQLSRPHFVICTHDYEHVDLFCMARIAKKWFAFNGIPTAFVVADRYHNHVFCGVVHKGKCIPVRQHTTLKILQFLETHHVCMFVYRGTSATGAYHVCKSHKHNIVIRMTTPTAARCTLASGKAVSDILYDTLGCHMNVTFARPPPTNKTTAEKFMQDLLAQLYDQTSTVRSEVPCTTP